MVKKYFLKKRGKKFLCISKIYNPLNLLYCIIYITYRILNAHLYIYIHIFFKKENKVIIIYLKI